MTEIYIELGGKKAIAWSLEWPGWCSIRTSEAAVQALIETETAYGTTSSEPSGHMRARSGCDIHLSR